MCVQRGSECREAYLGRGVRERAARAIMLVQLTALAAAIGTVRCLQDLKREKLEQEQGVRGRDAML